MIVFILKFSACLLVLQAFYKLALEKESVHVFKRFYLIFSVVLALLIPLITITTVIVPSFDADVIAAPIILPEGEVLIEKPSTNWIVITLWSIYAIGVLLFSWKFLVNLLRLRTKILKNPKLNFRGFTNVLIHGLNVPYTFLTYIFINKTAFENNKIPNAVLLHEQAHAKQKHTLDILFLELVQILFWFNPMLHWLKRDMKQNHEYLADASVINQGVNVSTYQELLLSFSNHKANEALVHAINYSSIKKRLTLMKTKTSKTQSWVKSLILLPLLGILVYSFSEKEMVVEDHPQTKITAIDFQSNTKGASEAMMQEYKDFIINFNATRTIKNDSYDRAIAIYELMTLQQRNSVEKYPELLSLKNILVENAMKERVSAPTQQLINSWKDKSQYALWIDGKVAENSVLEDAKATDFKHYFQSKVYKNARSERFPQPFQVNIYSEDYFNAHFKNRDIKEYQKLAKNYTDALAVWLKGNRSDNSELKILKALADKVYDSFSNERKSQFNIMPTPPLPAEYPNAKDQKGASKAEIDEYNKLAKKYNSALNGKKVKYYEKEVKRMEFIYNKMTKSQKENAEPLPSIPPPPPPAPPAPKKEWKRVEETLSPNTKKGKVSKHDPKAEIIEVSEQLPPPPPPPPLDMEKLAKEGAVFYYEGNKVTAKEAITRFKSNKDLHVQVLNYGSKQPTVKLSKTPIVLEQVKKKVIVNGKVTSTNEYSMTKKELANIKLSLKSGELNNFKFKIPGVKTLYQKGNRLNGTAQRHVKEISKNSVVTLFDIKDSKKSKIAPIIIRIID